MYFDNFRKIKYGFDKKYFKSVTDIMSRVKIRDGILNNIALYDKYEVKSGETPEDVAFRHFGNPELHWVILLTNNIADRYYDWPMSEQEFEIFINDKYAEPGGIHHYEITQSSGPQTGSGPDDYDHKIEVNSTTAGATSVSNREYEQREQDKISRIKLLEPAFLPVLIEEFERLMNE